MPRKARIVSQSDIYHIMICGINQQTIFEDSEDYTKMLEVLRECKRLSGFKLYGYCLMSNHIHLLLKTENEDLGQIMKRIGARYVYWYNWKYQRSGPLFQDRFKSEPVEDDSYLLSVLRYIHQNPLKAGICEQAKQYVWSSYREYAEGLDLLDGEGILLMFSSARAKALELFKDYMDTLNEDRALDLETKPRQFSDQAAWEMIFQISGINNATDFQALDTPKRDISIRALKAKGLSIRQISRLTGLSVGIVRNK